MKNISDLANSLQENMQQEVENSKRIVKSVLDDHVNDIRNYTSESTRLIKNAIAEQNRQSRRLLLNSWKLAGLTFLLLSLATAGLILYQGKLIDDRWDTIRTQNKTIQNLKDQTFGIDLRELKDGRFITLPKNQKIETGWWVGEHQAIKLLDPEE